MQLLQRTQRTKSVFSFIVPEFSIKIGKRISDGLSVYTGEMVAILLALQWVEEVRPLRAVICSDSSSSLISLKNNESDERPDVLHHDIEFKRWD